MTKEFNQSLTKNTDLETILNDIACNFPTKDYFHNNGTKHVFHGATHACRTAFLVNVFYYFYKQFDDTANVISAPILKMLQITAAFHDAGRQDEGADQPIWEEKSGEHAKLRLIELGYEANLAYWISQAIPYKDKIDQLDGLFKICDKPRLTSPVSNQPDEEYTKQLLRMCITLLHESDCMEIDRITSAFDKNELLCHNQNRIDEIIKSHYTALNDFGDDPLSRDTLLQAQFENSANAYSQVATKMCQHQIFAELYEATLCLPTQDSQTIEIKKSALATKTIGDIYASHLNLEIKSLIAAIARNSADEQKIYDKEQPHKILFYHWVADELKNRDHITNIHHILSNAKIPIPEKFDELKKLKQRVVEKVDTLLFFPMENETLTAFLAGEDIDVKRLAAEKIAKKNKVVFGVDPITQSNINLKALKDEIGNLSKDEQRLIEQVKEILENGEFRHQTAFAAEINRDGYLTSPSTRRYNGKPIDSVISSNTDVEAGCVFVSFGPKGHKDQLLNDPGKTRYRFPANKYLGSDKACWLEPFKYAIFRGHQYRYEGGPALPKSVLGDTNIEVRHSRKAEKRTRTYIFRKGTKQISTLERDFTADTVIGDDIIPFISHLFILLTRRLKSFKSQLFSEENKDAISKVMNELFDPAYFEVLIPHSISIDDERITVTNDTTKKQPFDEAAHNQITMALENRNTTKIEAVLKEGVSIDIRRTKQDPTPLMQALSYEHNQEVIQFLLDQGADASACTRNYDVLTLAVKNYPHNQLLVEKILSNSKVNPNRYYSSDTYRYTSALVEATINDDLDTISLLFKHGLTLSGPDAVIAMDIAASSHNLDIVKKLLDHNKHLAWTKSVLKPITSAISEKKYDLITRIIKIDSTKLLTAISAFHNKSVLEFAVNQIASHYIKGDNEIAQKIEQAILAGLDLNKKEQLEIYLKSEVKKARERGVDDVLAKKIEKDTTISINLITGTDIHNNKYVLLGQRSDYTGKASGIYELPSTEVFSTGNQMNSCAIKDERQRLTNIILENDEKFVNPLFEYNQEQVHVKVFYDETNHIEEKHPTEGSPFISTYWVQVNKLHEFRIKPSHLKLIQLIVANQTAPNKEEISESLWREYAGPDALIDAIDEKDQPRIDELLTKGVSVYSKSRQRQYKIKYETVFAYALRNSEPSILDILVGKGGADLSTPIDGKNSDSPLCIAAAGGSVEIANWILNNSLKDDSAIWLSQSFKENLKTPLGEACEQAHVEMVEFLLKQGASIKQDEGIYVLIMLLEGREDKKRPDEDKVLAIINLLLKYDLDVNYYSDQDFVIKRRTLSIKKNTAFYLAAVSGYPLVVKRLLEEKPKIELIAIKNARNNLNAREAALMLQYSRRNTELQNEYRYINTMFSKYLALKKLEKYYIVANNITPQKKYQALIDHHKLIPFMGNKLGGTSKFLNGITTKLAKIAKIAPPELMLTQNGNKMVAALAGFDEPVIAIHIDFLLQLNSEYTVEELRFSLAHELLDIKNNLLVDNIRFAFDEFAIDKTLLADFYFTPEVAIKQLQNEHVFLRHHEGNPYLIFDKILSSIEVLVSATPTERIKQLQLYLAQQKNVFKKTQACTDFPEECIAEITQIEPVTFFGDFPQGNSAVLEQMEYLTANLDELKKELVPYELISIASSRVIEFCDLLRTINIDYSDAQHIEALNNLLNAAFDKRISAFEKIYEAAIPQAKDHKSVYGPFAKFQSAIDNFIHATDFTGAKLAAERMMEQSTRLANFQKRATIPAWSIPHLKSYVQEHDGALPVDDERYFGADQYLMEKTPIYGFKKTDSNQPPWSRHIEWASSDSSIKDALIRLGVKDEKLWKLIDANRLQKLAICRLSEADEIMRYKSSADGLIELNDNIVDYDLLRYLSKEHTVDASMFTNNSNFEAAFIQFFDANIVQLQNCTNAFNNDTEAVHILLGKFCDIAKEGTENEKNVARSFFLGRSDKRDIHNLRGFEEDQSKSSLSTQHIYYKFSFKQQYKEQCSTLFDLKHKLDILDGPGLYTFSIEQLSPEDWLLFFDINDTTFSLDCTEKLMMLMDKRKLSGYTKCVFDKHLSLHGQYSVLDPDTAKFIQLVNKCDHGHEHTAYILKKIDWGMENSAHEFSISSMAYVYRVFDHYSLFPSLYIQQQYGDLIISQIGKVNNIDEKIQSLEQLLFTGGDSFFKFPLSDVKFKNQLIQLWVNNIATKYGKDDSSGSYMHNEIFPVIKRVFAGTLKRDRISTLSQLANTLETQKKISDLIGKALEPEKYNSARPSSHHNDMETAIISQSLNLLAKDKNHQEKTLDFLASPLRENTLDNFASYLIESGAATKLARILIRNHFNRDLTKKDIPLAKDKLLIIYHLFWDLSLTERAVAINYLLIPADSTATEETSSKAYGKAFRYVTTKLFPGKETHDDFAIAFLNAYLDTADPYQRQYLLSALLVTTNEASNQKEITIGKKIALLCEHMGPAYVKLAQAIHSYPSTPDDIRNDLSHVKGRANPPHRWELWRLIKKYLPEEQVARIKRLGNLLGSASYNLAIPVEYVLGDENIQELVLLLQRENAEEDADKGFEHFNNAIKKCQHTTMNDLKDTLLEMVVEAQKLSHIELDQDSGDQQHKIANKLYNRTLLISDNGKIVETKSGEQIYDAKRRIGGKNICEVKFTPANNLLSGKYYRLLSKKPGIEFNNIPREEKVKRKLIAKAVVYIELVNILSGKQFDCDRHGNQLRIKFIEKLNQYQLGLYDFGEMSLDEMKQDEIIQLQEILKMLPRATIRSKNLDDIIADYIKQAKQTNKNCSNLMHIRKALLALHDFLQELTNKELLQVLNQVAQNDNIHTELKPSFDNTLWWLNGANYILDHAPKKVGFFVQRTLEKSYHNVDAVLHYLNFSRAH